MPDLSKLVGRNLGPLLAYVLAGASPEPIGQYVNAIVRMTDRAARTYEEARNAFAVVVAHDAPDSLPLRALLRGTDSLEHAVNALLRTHLLGERLRRQRGAPAISRSQLLLPTELERIRRMRHFAEHLEVKIASRQVGEHGLSSLSFRPFDDHVEYAGHNMTYSEMAACIRRFDRLSQRLLDST